MFHEHALLAPLQYLTTPQQGVQLGQNQRLAPDTPCASANPDQDGILKSIAGPH